MSTDQRVALVTGAGRGLGRSHALRLAARGIAVVVNDLGVAVDGSGSDPGPANDVVSEIRGNGGTAAVDRTDVASIEGGAAAVAAALDVFGRIDIVVNNAGFALGGGDAEHPLPSEIDALFAVHFKATVGTTSAAIPHMRQNGFGRIINTVSEVALDWRMASSLGYGAAKAAVWSATLSTARALEGSGITVNAISPGARTRMNSDLLDQGLRGGGALDLSPDHVSKLVAYLASDAAGDITGKVIHAAAGAFREYTTARTSKSPLVGRLEEALAGYS